MIDFDGIEILLVDDNDADAELTLRALAKCNINNKLFRVADGVDALDFIAGKGAFEGRDIRQSPRLILLDLSMPRLSGLEVLRSLKGNPRTAAIPVVIMTVSNQERDLAECYRLGANGFASKPLDFDELTKSIARIGMYWLLVNRVA